MSASDDTLPPLKSALGRDGWRCRGITSWRDVGSLGGRNVRSLREWAQDAANRALVDEDREFLVEMRPAMDRLVTLAGELVEEKPLLPQLRRESFRRGQQVRVYVGELPGTSSTWAKGTITAIDKSFNLRWKSAQPNSGYYWRITARLDAGAPHEIPEVHFSTSEPRVVTEQDFVWLHGAVLTDMPFVRIFAENCRRDWPPLWCQELGITIDTATMDPLAWLQTS